MVLDEEALEAMLRRQKVSDGEEPAQARLTDETEEFEVYERPSQGPAHEPETPPAPTPPPVQPQYQEPPEPARSAPQVVPSLSHAPPRTDGPAAEAPPAQVHASGGGTRIALVHCRFNHQITDRMAEVATQRAQEAGCTVETVQVAGVYDAPLAAQRLARRPDIDAVVVVGVVVKGDTDHDQVITQATATNLQRVALDTDTPVGLGITGPGMSWAEAQARVDNAAHAVDAVLELLQITA